jgi:hypothetical protein
MNVQIVTAQPSDWATYRELRLRSLRESPDAYGSTYAFEADFSAELWQQRLAGATTFMAALDGDRGAPIGTATGLGRSPVSSSGFLVLVEESLEGAVVGGVVGGVVLPAVPDDVEPGAGEDAGGVGVVVVSGA